jgi:hypothetical protein
MRHTNQILFAVGLFLGLQACSGDPDAPSSEMKLHKECLKTVCAARAEQNSNACSRCLDVCSSASYDCDPSRECEVSCGDTSDCSSDACEDEGFKATLPNNPSAEILAACGRERAHVSECGYEAKNIDCTTYSKVERPEMAPYYDCVAMLSCDDLANKDAVAKCEPATTTFGDDLCAKLEAKCAGTCSDDVRAALDAEGPWLRDDAKSAAASCANQSTCGDVGECLSAWKSAVGL